MVQLILLSCFPYMPPLQAGEWPSERERRATERPNFGNVVGQCLISSVRRTNAVAASYIASLQSASLRDGR